MEDVRRCVHFDTWGFQWIGLRCFHENPSVDVYIRKNGSKLPFQLVVGPQLSKMTWILESCSPSQPFISKFR